MTRPVYTLVIGTKNWSSWSLRPWLLMQVAGLAFHEIEIPLRTEGTKAAIRAHAPAGQVPVLKIEGGPSVWESLAIAEVLAERHPELALWPREAAARARARSVSAEMHAGFRDLRMQMPMSALERVPGVVPTPETAADIARVQEIWRGARTEFGDGGPFLFGAFSIADAMFAPVVSRFVTYGVALGPVEQAYAETIFALPAMKRWLDGCAEWACLEAARSRS